MFTITLESSDALQIVSAVRALRERRAAIKAAPKDANDPARRRAIRAEYDACYLLGSLVEHIVVKYDWATTEPRFIEPR